MFLNEGVVGSLRFGPCGAFSPIRDPAPCMLCSLESLGFRVEDSGRGGSGFRGVYG